MSKLDLDEFEKNLGKKLRRAYDSAYDLQKQAEQGTLQVDTLYKTVEVLSEQLKNIRGDLRYLLGKLDVNADLERVALKLLIDSLQKDAEAKKQLSKIKNLGE